MSLKIFLKKSSAVVSLHKNSLELRRTLANLGLLPINPLRFRRIPRYLKDKRTFIGKGGVISHAFPIVSDFKDSAGTGSGHYFHQDLLVAQFIFQANPKKHIDVGSRIDGFVAHVASFREIEVLDIRELPKSDHSNILYKKADLMSDVEDEITESLSCLHVIEHLGLGRYGDPIDPKGYIFGFKNLIKMLKPGGVLYISFPIGTSNEVHFNAHRVFQPRDIFSWAPDTLKLLRFDFVDDLGALHKDVDVLNSDMAVSYGCGIYTFTKM